MNKGEISVIMSVYNCESTICQSIDSILAQTYKNWKFIICDDCSTDRTPQIIKEYAERFPQKFVIIRNKQNSKLAYSLNRCLRKAEGEFCARMDGDDYCDPERFEKQVSVLRQRRDVQLVGTNMRVFNDNGLGRIVTYRPEPVKEDLRYGPCFAHASIMTYTSVYKKLKGYTVSRRTERAQDYDLWFRFYAAGFKGTNIMEPLYYVREDGNSYKRRKISQYLWVVVTRWKGFRVLHYPVRYYWRVFTPIFRLLGNEVRVLLSEIGNSKWTG